MRIGLIAVLAWCGVAQAADPPGEVRISLERYEQLMKGASRSGSSEVTWGRGDVSVELPDDAGQFAKVTLSATVRVVGDGSAEVVLLPADVVLEDVSFDGSAATLLRRAGAHVAVLPAGQGSANVTLRYLVAARPAAAGGRLVLVPLPPLPSSSLRVDGATDVWPGADVQHEGDTLKASLPATLAAVIRFGQDEGRQVGKVEYDLTVNAEGDGMDADVRYEVQVGGAEAVVRLAPSSVALVDVKDGKDSLVTRVRDDWHEATVRGAGRHVLTARLSIAVDRTQGQPQVLLTLDKAPITRVTTNVRGQHTITLEPVVPLTTTVRGEGDAATTTATAWLPPSEEVTIKWTESRAAPEQLVRINADTYQLVTVQEGVMRSRVEVRYEVLRGKAKELSLEIPEDVVLYKVTGEGIEDWRTFAKEATAPRQVRVFLGKEHEGTYALTLELEASIARTEGAPLSIPIVRPLGAFRETGVVALFDGDKVGFAPAEPAQYTKVGQDALPVEIRQDLKATVSQAFKHIGPPGAIASKLATAKAREVRFDARILTLFSVKDGAIVANASVAVEVKSGRRDKLVLTFPKGVAVLDVTAPSMNKKEEIKDFPGGRLGYEISFSQALEGAIQVDLEYEMLLAKEGGPVVLPDVRVQDAEVEEGSFGIAAETGIEVQPGTATDLRRVDVADLPKSVRLRSPGEVLMGYQYAHTPWSLELAVKRHETVETLKAVVKAAWLETTVFEDGHAVTRAVFDVKNEDRQFLRLTMPEGGRVWTVTADGAPVKAVSDETGALAVPLAKGKTVQLVLVYEVKGDALGMTGGLDLTAPRPDALVTDLQWLVRTPVKYTVLKTHTRLEEKDAKTYRAPNVAPMDVALPTEESHDRLFTLAVADPADEAPAVGLRYVATPGDWLGSALWIACILLLAFFVRLRAAGRSLGVAGALALLFGILTGTGKLFGWGLDATEAIVAVVALLGTGIASAVFAKKKVDAP